MDANNCAEDCKKELGEKEARAEGKQAEEFNPRMIRGRL